MKYQKERDKWDMQRLANTILRKLSALVDLRFDTLLELMSEHLVQKSCRYRAIYLFQRRQNWEHHGNTTYDNNDSQKCFIQNYWSWYAFLYCDCSMFSPLVSQWPVLLYLLGVYSKALQNAQHSPRSSQILFEDILVISISHMPGTLFQQHTIKQSYIKLLFQNVAWRALICWFISEKLHLITKRQLESLERKSMVITMSGYRQSFWILWISC